MNRNYNNTLQREARTHRNEAFVINSNITLVSIQSSGNTHNTLQRDGRNHR
jgi:hypothetical protein